MKVEKSVRRRRAAGKKWRPAALILAAVLVFLSLPLTGQKAYAIDLDEKCSLTVNISNGLSDEEKQDLADANIVVDIYRIAEAVPVQGYDTYDLSLLPPYNSPEAGIEITKEIDAAGWKTVAQKAAAYALGTVPEGTDAMKPAPVSSDVASYDGSGQAIGTTISGMDPGLYLIVMHGAKDEEYVTTASKEEGVTEVATLANSTYYKYTFSPELIALPTKPADENGTINTANPGDWNPAGAVDLAITPKYSKEPRLGSLRIIKDLKRYENHNKATFVFEISGTIGEGANQKALPGDVVSIVYDGTGSAEKSVVIDNLPAKAKMTVKEVYSGKSYTIDVDDTDTKDATIIANDIVEVKFTNDYNDRHNGGGSILNHFEYVQDRQDSAGHSLGEGWDTPTQHTDSTEGN